MSQISNNADNKTTALPSFEHTKTSRSTVFASSILTHVTTSELETKEDVQLSAFLSTFFSSSPAASSQESYPITSPYESQSEIVTVVHTETDSRSWSSIELGASPSTELILETVTRFVSGSMVTATLMPTSSLDTSVISSFATTSELVGTTSAENTRTPSTNSSVLATAGHKPQSKTYEVTYTILGSTVTELRTTVVTGEAASSPTPYSSLALTPKPTGASVREHTAGLSKNEKIAVGVAVPLGFVALVATGAVVIWVWIRRRQDMGARSEKSLFSETSSGFSRRRSKHTTSSAHNMF